MFKLDPSALQAGVLVALAGIAVGAFCTGQYDLAKDIALVLGGALGLNHKTPDATPPPAGQPEG